MRSFRLIYEHKKINRLDFLENFSTFKFFPHSNDTKNQFLESWGGKNWISSKLCRKYFVRLRFFGIIITSASSSSMPFFFLWLSTFWDTHYLDVAHCTFKMSASTLVKKKAADRNAITRNQWATIETQKTSREFCKFPVLNHLLLLAFDIAFKLHFLCNNIQPFSKRTLSILSIFFLFSPLCVFSLAFCITSYDITTINFHSETIKHTTTLTPSLALFLSLSLACMYVQKLHCINAFLCIISDSDEKLRRRLLFFSFQVYLFTTKWVSEWVRDALPQHNSSQ